MEVASSCKAKVVEDPEPRRNKSEDLGTGVGAWGCHIAGPDTSVVSLGVELLNLECAKSGAVLHKNQSASMFYCQSLKRSSSL